MIITLKKNAPKHDVDKLIDKFEGMNLHVTMIQGDNYNVFGLVGDTSVVDEKALWLTLSSTMFSVSLSLINWPTVCFIQKIPL